MDYQISVFFIARQHSHDKNIHVLLAVATHNLRFVGSSEQPDFKALLERDGVDKPGGWVTVLPPTEKSLASEDIGIKGMMDWRDIVTVVQNYLYYLAELIHNS
ncbi:Flavoprotein [Penicillium sp. IBT 31633x]|nr:Flavoprotein [Penicillium sp. IBT 31633x]